MLAPTMIQREYLNGIRTYLRRMRAIVQLGLLPELPKLLAEAEKERRSDGASTDASYLIDHLARQFIDNSPTGEIERLASSMAIRTSRLQRQELGKVLGVAIGTDPLNVFTEPNIPARIEQFTTENVALIKSVSETYFSDVKKVVLSGIGDGDRADALSDEIESRFGVSDSKADLIARDQIGKFYGDLNEARQGELGITSYVWRTSQDERVRDEHEQREGVEFDWDDPPEDGNPGEPILCRCFAEPVLDEILGDL
jgi:SPP1 gp7 family putative phage head morphogenesis protein